MAIWDQVRWPALLFGRPNCVMQQIDSPDGLTHIRYAGINAINRLSEYYLVDSGGNVFRLHDVHVKAEIGICRKVLFALCNPLIEAEYGGVSRDGTLTIDVLRERMMQDINEHHEYWSDVSDIENRITQIKQANTVEALIRVF
jgi:hypothetical protein